MREICKGVRSGEKRSVKETEILKLKFMMIFKVKIAILKVTFMNKNDSQVCQVHATTTSTPVSAETISLPSGERDNNLDSASSPCVSSPHSQQPAYSSQDGGDEYQEMSNEQKVKQGHAKWKYVMGSSRKKRCPRCKICDNFIEPTGLFGHCDTCLLEGRNFDFHKGCLENSGFPKHKHDEDVHYGVYPYDVVVSVT